MTTAVVATPQGLLYIPTFLSAAEQQTLLHQLAGLTFTRDVFRGQPMKRAGACFGREYIATGRQLRPASPFTEPITQVSDKTLPHCPAGTQFDQCIIQQYPIGAGIGWHTDAPVFGDVIVGV